MPQNPEKTGSSSSFLKQHWVTSFLFVLMAVLICGMIYLIATANAPSQRESALEALLLTSASFVASYLVTKIYAEATYSQTLRDHGVQIASGIMVLKRQIENLADWISGKRARLTNAGERQDEMASSLEHVEESLNGFIGLTDAALGGISGVIGGALAEYDAIMQQITHIRSDALIKTDAIKKEMQNAVSVSEIDALRAKIEEIARETESSVAKLSLKSALPIPEPPRNRVFRGACPNCHKETAFEMLERTGETKVISCQFCSQRFYAHYLTGREILTRAYPSNHVTLDDFSTKAKRVLVNTKAWINPVQIDGLLNLVVSHDKGMRERGEARSPTNLQASLLRDSEGLLRAEIGKAVIRTFMSLIYWGRAFAFPAGVEHSFKGAYINVLDHDTLLKSYVHSCIYKISLALPVESKNAPELARLIPGAQSALGEDLVRWAISNVDALSKRQPGVDNQQGLEDTS